MFKNIELLCNNMQKLWMELNLIEKNILIATIIIAAYFFNVWFYLFLGLIQFILLLSFIKHKIKRDNKNNRQQVYRSNNAEKITKLLGKKETIVFQQLATYKGGKAPLIFLTLSSNPRSDIKK